MKSKSKNPTDAVVVYGLHAVSSLLTLRPQSASQLWVAEEREDQALQSLLQQAEALNLPVQRQARKKLDEVAQGVHQGVVLWAKARQPGSESDLEQLLERLDRPALLLVLDGVTDPHNLGACLRSADAAGADAVITTKDRAAGLNATVRKVACGAAESLPLIQVTNLARTLRQLASYGVWIVGAAGEAEDLVYQAELQRSTALVLGAEGAGLRRLTREQCDQLVRLPMVGSVSSLNVSVAAGVLLYEAVRQRQLVSLGRTE